MQVLIRPAALSDLDQLHAMVHRAYRGDAARAGWTHEADLLDGQRTDMEELRAIVDSPAQELLVAENGGELTGCVQITDKGGATAYLGLLSIDPAHQAAGLGRKLIDAAEAAAVQRFGAATMEMSVIRQREELIAYYERRGYSRTGEERPFPLDDPRFGIPKRRDLSFVVLAKPINRT